MTRAASTLLSASRSRATRWSRVFLVGLFVKTSGPEVLGAASLGRTRSLELRKLLWARCCPGADAPLVQAVGTELNAHLRARVM